MAQISQKQVFVPERCRRSPNCQRDSDFGLYICRENNRRCFYFGPSLVVDQNGRHFECRKKDADDQD
jgi:hypothetical protein